ncbi:MAG: ABC transporter ATP-binding protein [Sphingomonadales bacterium]
MISFQNAQVGYQTTLIELAPLALPAGQIYALIGRNGSGKTTLLHSLIGQLPLRSGSITLGAYSLDEFQKNAALRSRQVSFVASMFAGLDALTLRAYVSLGRVPHLGAFGRLQAADLQIVDEVLQALNLSSLAYQDTRKLSDGERQLASLARAMVQDTPIMVLDEPASFLDYFNRELLLDQLQNWVQQKPARTAVFSSHDIDLCLQKGIPMLVLHQRRLTLLMKPTKAEVMALL